MQICMLSIEETTTLKCDKFNEDTIYHILPEFGPQGYIRRLSSEIMSAKFHDVQMIWDGTDQDPMNVLVVCEALETRFDDNHVMKVVLSLGPTHVK